MPYTFDQEFLINKSVKKDIQELQQLLHDKKCLLSDRQREAAKRELKEYQELQYQNRLNRQINLR